jgi:hypothetical protein
MGGHFLNGGQWVAQMLQNVRGNEDVNRLAQAREGRMDFKAHPRNKIRSH